MPCFFRSVEDEALRKHLSEDACLDHWESQGIEDTLTFTLSRNAETQTHFPLPVLRTQRDLCPVLPLCTPPVALTGHVCRSSVNCPTFRDWRSRDQVALGNMTDVGLS